MKTILPLLTLGLLIFTACTPTPIPEPKPIPQPQTLPLSRVFMSDPFAPSWLNTLNEYRAQAGVPTVSEESTLSAGCLQHTQYMVENQYVGHSENPALPFYSAAGLRCAQKGDVFSSSTNRSEAYTFERWITGPFHALGVLRPNVPRMGYGAVLKSGLPRPYAAALDMLSSQGNAPFTPYAFPAQGARVTSLTYQGDESPDPLQPCAGYIAPTGGPILLALGREHSQVAPQVTLLAAGNVMASCSYTAQNLTDPLGAALLRNEGVTVIVPRNPLPIGAQITVSSSENGVTYTWTFTTE